MTPPPLLLLLLLPLLLPPPPGARADRSPLTFPTTVYEYAYTAAADFVPSVLRRSCLLPPDKGPCRAKVPMYYFDYSQQSCAPLAWGGCQGNGNRFRSAAQCLAACLNTNTSKPVQPNFCHLSFDYGFCFGDVKRWHYDRAQHVCKARVFSGCGGNPNNFVSKQVVGQPRDIASTVLQCENACMYMRTYPTKKTDTPPSMPMLSDEDK